MGNSCKIKEAVLLVLKAALVGGVQAAAAAAERPNIVFILADDMGWADASCYGVNRRFKTPNIDRLADEGIRFEQFYQAATVCSPSRAAQITGRWPAEVNVHWAFSRNSREMGMDDYLDPASTPFLPQLLKQAGYATAHVGKWHLGWPGGLERNPAAYGFDFVRWPDYRSGCRNLGKLPDRPHSTKILVDAAISLLDEVKEVPFYIQLWLLDPHGPLIPKQEWMEEFRNQEPEGFTSPYMVYAASMTEMDHQIGRVLDYLDEQGLANNTIVIFSSDNGPEDEHAMDSNWSAYGSSGPFRGGKRTLYEGGTRVPLVVRWPQGGVPAGVVNKKSIVSGVDLFPTLCALAGAEVPAEVRQLLRGENIAAAWRGDLSFQREVPLYWERRATVLGEKNCSPRVALRDGKWKLLFNPEDNWIELYDMESDYREENNIAPSRPEVVDRLLRQAYTWLNSLPPGPVHPRAGRRYGNY